MIRALACLVLTSCATVPEPNPVAVYAVQKAAMAAFGEQAASWVEWSADTLRMLKAAERQK